MSSDPLFPLMLILRYMHILGAIALMGGTIFMRLALAPVVAGLEPDVKAHFHEQVRGRWARFVALAAALLLISGVANLGLAANYEFKPVLSLDKGYHLIVGIKFLLALPIFFIASMLTGRSQAAQRFQAQARWWMNVNLALALTMVLIGGALKFVHRVPKPSRAGIAAAVASASSPLPPFPVTGARLPARGTPAVHHAGP
jgi:uncharacterized membrane protein